MARVRFKKQEADSFFGNLVYDRVVHEDHFLRKLEAIVPWERFTERLIEYYRGGGMYGRPPYEPAVLLKMLLIAYLYDLSERQTEEHARDSLATKWFLGLAVDEDPPDHTTLSKFRQRLIRYGKQAAFEGMLDEILQVAQEAGVQLGAIQLVDSVHTIADVNTAKDKRRNKGGKPPRDGDATWGAKGKRVVRDTKGRGVEVPRYFFGYKAHVSLNTGSELITSLTVTPGNAYDGHQLPDLLERDLARGIPIETLAADRGYDDGDNHYLLETMGIHSAIALCAYRTQKKDSNKQVWIRLRASRQYQQGKRERYKVERKFGEAKTGHGLRRCRYLGQAGYLAQATLTAMALNLKRLVKLLTGTNFKGRARAWT